MNDENDLNIGQITNLEVGNIENDQSNLIEQKQEYCTCKSVTTVYSDTESSDFGYWDVCGSCNKKIKDSFHYYNHYDGEDHDDIDLYC